MNTLKKLITYSLIAVAGPTCMAAEPAVYGRLYPERNDDLSWENRTVAFRVYGPKTQQNGEKSYGYDIFLKYPGKGLVLEELYGNQCSRENWRKADSLKQIDPELSRKFQETFNYHINHGKGMDCYAVGSTLGCGVPAVLTGDSILYPWCYEKVDIIENGPDRFRARLQFAPKIIEGDTVTEIRTIVLDADSHLNYSEVTYQGATHPLTVVTGFPRRDNGPTYANAKKGIIALVDPTQGPDNGKILVGLKMLNRNNGTFERENHLLISATLRPGEPLRYYWGYAWDITDITTLDAWIRYLTRFPAAPRR